MFNLDFYEVRGHGISTNQIPRVCTVGCKTEIFKIEMTNGCKSYSLWWTFILAFGIPFIGSGFCRAEFRLDHQVLTIPPQHT